MSAPPSVVVGPLPEQEFSVRWVALGPPVDGGGRAWVIHYFADGETVTAPSSHGVLILFNGQGEESRRFVV